MTPNNLKKMIIFSSERNRTIIERMISVEANVENRSASALIEKHIMHDLLPQNPSASTWVQFLYDGTWGIGDVLSACFGYLACGGSGWTAKHDNAFEIVRFAHHWECMSNSLPDVDAQEMPYFMSQFDSLVTKLQKIAKETKDSEAENEAHWAEELYKIAKEEPEYMRYGNIYQLIMNNWEYLKNWSITYRLLMSMASMEKHWHDYDMVRYELVRLLKEVSAEWND